MSTLQGKRRPLTIRVPKEDHPHDHVTDRLLHWGASAYGKRLPKKAQWIRDGCLTGDYAEFKPSYVFDPRSKADRSDGVAVAINQALERCFGSRGSKGWCIWIQGDELLKALSLFRTEYVKLEHQNDPLLGLLDLWADDLLVEMQRIWALDEPTLQPPPAAPSNILLGLPLVRRSARSPLRTSRVLGSNADDSPDRQSDGSTSRTQQPRRKLSFSVSDSAEEEDEDEDADEDSVSEKSEEDIPDPKPSKGQQKKRTKKTNEKGGAKKTKALKRKRKALSDLDDDEILVLNDDDVPAFECVARNPSKKSKAQIQMDSQNRSSKNPVQLNRSAISHSSPPPNASDPEESQEGDNGDENFGCRPYFYPGVPVVGRTGQTTYSYQCRHCPKKPKAGRTGTWNLRVHQKVCVGLVAAKKKGAPGVVIGIADHNSYQSTLNRRDAAIVKVFDPQRFTEEIVHWIALAGLPFRVVESTQLRSAFAIANPLAQLPSSSTVARSLEDAYERVQLTVDALLQDQCVTIHYGYDAWTDSQHRKSYLGLVACFVNKRFEYQEVLLRLVPLVGGHGGRRIGESLFPLLVDVGIARNVGPGTADNASANGRTAERMSELIFEHYQSDMDPKNLMGCVCHIANFAAHDYLNAEAGLDVEDYALSEQDLPSIRITEDGDDCRILRELGVDGVWSTGMDELNDLEEDETDGDGDGVAPISVSDTTQADAGGSPLDLVARLGLYVHGKADRVELFKTVRTLKTPKLSILPTRDVPTRWNSKELAIDRVLQLKDTILLYCQKSKGCPQFDDTTFEILELIQPALQIFADLTATYSTKAANLHRVLPDLHYALSELETLGSNPKLTEARSRSFKVAASKIKEYLLRFLHNDWVCAAYALAPDNRAPALKRILDAYGLRRRMSAIVKWIKEKIKERTDDEQDGTALPSTPFASVSTSKGRSLSRRPNAFSSRQNSSPSISQTDFEDAWERWNMEDGARYLENEDEGILQYWKRMNRISDLRPLARVAQDVLGMPGSSTSVERLFSQAGLLVTKKRGNLSARMLVKQTSLKVWGMEGHYVPGSAGPKAIPSTTGTTGERQTKGTGGGDAERK